METDQDCGAVIVGGYVTDLATVRALAGNGIPVVVISTKPDDIAHCSRWVSEYHKLFEFGDHPESLIEFLERRSQLWRGWVILPGGDRALEVLSQNRDRLLRWYRMTVPPWEVARRVLHKDLTYQAARQIGVDIAYVYGQATRETIEQADIRFPVLVKPIESQPFVERFGRKLFVARDHAELRRRIQELDASELRAQIVDLVPGPDSLSYNYCVYIDRSGEPSAEFAMRKLRQCPPFFGISRAIEPASAPQLGEPSIEILRHIEWRGMANVAYKLDARDGRYRLMEVNGRSCLTHGLAWRAGINCPLLTWRECVLGAKVRASPNGWNGVWLHLLDEVYCGVFFRRIERLGWREHLSPYRRPKTFAVWSATDPKPFWVEWSHALRKAARLAFDPHARMVLQKRV